MQVRFAAAALAVLLAATGSGYAVAAESARGGLAGQDVLVAQGAGYDPMRRPRTSPDAAERPEANPELGGLPDAPGAEETFYQCSACHSIALVRQQRLSDARWDHLWTWMIEEQGMPETDEETRTAILDYLKTYFSSSR